MTRHLLPTLALLGLAVSAPAAPPDAATLRARAALALAFSDPPAYAGLYAKAVAEKTPLVVWVGQPPRAVPGCLTTRAADFPKAEKVCAVVGVPDADSLRRIDLPGTPTDDEVRAVVKDAAGTTATLPPMARK